MRLIPIFSIVVLILTSCNLSNDNPYSDIPVIGSEEGGQNNPYDNLGGPSSPGGWGIIESIPNLFGKDNPYDNWGNSNDQQEVKPDQEDFPTVTPTPYPPGELVTWTPTPLPAPIAPEVPTQTPIPYVPPTAVPLPTAVPYVPPPQQVPVPGCVCHSQFKPGETRQCGEPPHPGDDSKCTADGTWVRIR